MSNTEVGPPAKRSDIAGLWLYVAIGAGLVVWTIVSAVIRLTNVIPNRDVRVYGEFAGTMGEAPIGPNGAPAPVELASAYLIAPELPVASVVALVLEQLVIVAAVTTVVVCFLLLQRSVIRGQVFSTRNTVLVATASVVGYAGVIGAPFFANMGANGAFAWISDRTFENVTLSAGLPLIFGIPFAAALLLTVFTVGERLQRDTKGLV